MAEKYFSLSQLKSISRIETNQWNGPSEVCDLYDLKKLPPADVRPVVRGVWRFEKQGPEDYEQFWRCSVCADKTYFITNYCHNCGADMRGGDADGEEKD